MKYNILLEVNHPVRGFLGNGTALREARETDKDVMLKMMEQLSTAGLRENGLTLWQEDELFCVGKSLAEECIIQVRIIEVT